MTWCLLRLDGHVRIDVRMDHSGNIYVIDVNSYPALFYDDDIKWDADFILANSKIMNTVAFIEHNLNVGIKRNNARISSK